MTYDARLVRRLLEEEHDHAGVVGLLTGAQLDGEGHYLLAVAHTGLGEEDPALHHFAEALRGGAPAEWVFYNRANLWFRKGRTQEALSDLAACYALADDHPGLAAFLPSVLAEALKGGALGGDPAVQQMVSGLVVKGLSGERTDATGNDSRGPAQEAIGTMAALERVRRRGRRIRVLFVVHFIEVWTGLEAVYHRMSRDPEFEAVVVSVSNDFADFGGALAGEERVHEHLARAGVPHVRWGAMNQPGDEDMVRVLAPDVVFRQTPWDGSVPPPLRTAQLAFTRLCYVPYNLYVAEAPQFLVNLPYLQAAWRIFAINETNKEYFDSHSRLGVSNAVTSGHPKLDHLLGMRRQVGAWPIAGDRGFRVLWAPHHSFDPDWLGFGTFANCCSGMLEWARDDPSVQILMRPHHLTFKQAVDQKAMTREELDAFLAEWEALSNTGFDPEPDCGPAFAASDVLLTDGVSFLAEYLPMGKPLVSLRKATNFPLTELGVRVAEANYRFDTVDEAIGFMKTHQATGEDPMLLAREAALAFLMPQRGRAAELIVEDIRRGVREERRAAS